MVLGAIGCGRGPRLVARGLWFACGLWAAGFGLLVVGCGLWVVGCGLWVMGYGLWVVGCGLWVMGYGLWVVGCGLWVVGCGLWMMGTGYGCGQWVMGLGRGARLMGHWHGGRTWAWASITAYIRVTFRFVEYQVWGAPMPLSLFGCDAYLVACCVISLAISHSYGDPVPEQQLGFASSDCVAETMVKRGGCGNHASIYQNSRVPLFGLCHRRARALLT